MSDRVLMAERRAKLAFERLVPARSRLVNLADVARANDAMIEVFQREIGDLADVDEQQIKSPGLRALIAERKPSPEKRG